MTLHCEVHGHGPDLVLLHGWGMNAAVWNDVAADLAKHFRVHSVDLPGYGNSAASEPYTLAGITNALAAALPHPAVVCGWSLGGQVALSWALSAPRQIERLVLIATTPRFVNGAQWESGIDAVSLESMIRGLADDCRATLQRFLASQAQDDIAGRAVLRWLREKMLMHPEPAVATLAAGLQILKETDLRERLPQIAQPALILHGERDVVVPLAAGVYLQRALPHAVLEVCAGAAHAPFAACPQRTAQRIVEFCREQ